jgi:exodeoxyribonuclease-5
VIWSAQQERALRKVGDWLQKRDKPYFTLAGYAGTGKTTLAKELTSGIGGTVYFAAYTGKAAHVLLKTGIRSASTIHRLIYLPRDKCGQKLIALQKEHDSLSRRNPRPEKELAKIEGDILKEQQNLSRPEFTLNTDGPLATASLCVIDEYSMVGRQMGADLLSFGCPILALGDPGQLPPIEGDQFFTKKPDVMLDEIHRQAADNPIIRLSKDVREGRPLRPGTYGKSRVVRRGNVSDDELGKLILETDQLLLGMNRTRRQFNAYARELRGYNGMMPVVGDKLVCLRNNPDAGLLNGQTWVVKRVVDKKTYLQLGLVGEDGEKTECLSHMHRFLGKDKDKGFDPRRLREFNDFDYGYALTVHKAQGSQWDNVVLIDEWRMDKRKEWLYTAITRAAESIVVIQ